MRVKQILVMPIRMMTVFKMEQSQGLQLGIRLIQKKTLSLMLIAARNALSRLMPEQSDILASNFKALERDLIDLDARLKATVARNPARPLIASHPVYQYLAWRYSLNLKSVMWEPNTVPPETEWQALAELRQGHPATWMLWESDPALEISQRLQLLGVQSTVFDPCGNEPVKGDFLSVMFNNLASMAHVFDQEIND